MSAEDIRAEMLALQAENARLRAELGEPPKLPSSFTPKQRREIGERNRRLSGREAPLATEEKEMLELLVQHQSLTNTNEDIRRTKHRPGKRWF